MTKKDRHFDTLQVHGGYNPSEHKNAAAIPIYYNADFFTDNKKSVYEFTPEPNPTNQILEQRIAMLEGGKNAVAFASGLSAQYIALSAFLEAGDNFICTSFLYGGTHNQFKLALKRIGIEVRIVEGDTAPEFERLIDQNTKALYVETIGNPEFNVPDFQALAALAHKYEIPFVVDNTFGAGGYLCRPLEWGANIVTSSATKWIGGHGTSIGGVVVDGGTFFWGSGKFPSISEECESSYDRNFMELYGDDAYYQKVRYHGMLNYGTVMSPFNSWLILQGLETLSLRMERCVSNTLAVALWLQRHPSVISVNYPGLETSPYHELAQKYLNNGYGGVLSFRIKGGVASALEFVNEVSLISHLANIGDAKTLIVHPASTTHQQMTEDESFGAGIYPNTLRLSVGLEHIDDILADLDHAFMKLNKLKM